MACFKVVMEEHRMEDYVTADVEYTAAEVQANAEAAYQDFGVGAGTGATIDHTVTVEEVPCPW